MAEEVSHMKNWLCLAGYSSSISHLKVKILKWCGLHNQWYFSLIMKIFWDFNPTWITTQFQNSMPMLSTSQQQNHRAQPSQGLPFAEPFSPGSWKNGGTLVWKNHLKLPMSWIFLDLTIAYHLPGKIGPFERNICQIKSFWMCLASRGILFWSSTNPPRVGEMRLLCLVTRGLLVPEVEKSQIDPFKNCFRWWV